MVRLIDSPVSRPSCELQPLRTVRLRDSPALWLSAAQPPRDAARAQRTETSNEVGQRCGRAVQMTRTADCGLGAQLLQALLWPALPQKAARAKPGGVAATQLARAIRWPSPEGLEVPFGAWNGCVLRAALL